MILYIHPLTQMFLRSLLPMSLPALINRLPKPVLGKFEEEVTRGTQSFSIRKHGSIEIPRPAICCSIVRLF